MYKYSLKGWQRPTEYTSSTIHGVQPFVSSSTSPVDPDEADEIADVAAPLPGESAIGSKAPRDEIAPAGDETLSSTTTAGGSADDDDRLATTNDSGTGGFGGTSRTFAKDKRKLREKRRSTGVAKYCHEGHDQSEHAEEQHHDDETVRNTSFNEINVSAVDADSSAEHARTSADHVTVPANTTTASSCHGSGEPDRTSDARPAAHAPKPRPNLPLKPALRMRPGSTPAVSGTAPQRTLAGLARQDRTRDPFEEERQAFVNRIQVLEKLLETERRENSSLKEKLVQHETRISELETEVNALNEDLDLADEDFEKLEAENRVLMRAMSQLSAQ